MVITYSTEELMAIGEKVLDVHPQDWLAQQQHLLALLHLAANENQRLPTKDPRDNQLTESVAEFFRKAQQNFHPTIGNDIKPTRVRRLSDVEAELKDSTMVDHYAQQF